jgi:hypothetical protein
MFNSQTTWSLSKGGPNLTDDTPFIEHPLVTWWFNSKKLDVKELFGMRKDDIGEYVVAAGR